MCSYNAINGVPSCANDLINNKIARNEWGFEGYIVRYIYTCMNRVLLLSLEHY